MEPADAVGLTRCVYRCYGYSYVDPMLYRPAQVRRALERGVMRSTVAVTDGGEVAGHCALVYERPGDPVPEGGRMVVDPRWRGHHVAERMAERRSDAARRDGVAGYWGECVTVHPFSQREMVSVGGAETGLLIAAAPPTHMEGLDDGAPGRRSLLAMYVPLAERSPQVVHVPPRHRDLLLVMAERLGLPRDARVSRSRAVGSTTIRSGVDRNLGTAHLRLGAVGHDLVDRVRAELAGLAAFSLAAVHLDIPLADPAASDAVEQLEERLGFCWAAWLPSFVGSGDVLRLQLVLDRSVDLAGIECARPEGAEVRDRVIAEWSRVRR
jgi:serine/threonine-protein kinase RsbW